MEKQNSSAVKLWNNQHTTSGNRILEQYKLHNNTEIISCDHCFCRKRTRADTFYWKRDWSSQKAF